MDQQEEEKQFYEAYGRAIADWALVEYHLCELFTVLSRSQDPTSSKAAFYGIESFRSKLDSTDSIAEYYFSDERWVEWRALYDDVKSAALTRNRLAHWTVIIEPTKKPRRRVLLKPTVYNPTNAKQTVSIATDDFAKVRAEFFNAIAGLRNFAARISGFPEPLPGCYVQKFRQQQNQNKAAQNQEAPESPPPSSPA